MLLNMFTIEIVKFSDWLNQQFFLWRGDSRKTVTEFAQYIGVSQQVMDKWMNPKLSIVPKADSIGKIGAKFPEIYGVLGLPIPGLSLDNSNLLISASRELNREVKEKGIDIEDPEFESLVTRIFAKYGIRATRDD